MTEYTIVGADAPGGMRHALKRAAAAAAAQETSPQEQAPTISPQEQAPAIVHRLLTNAIEHNSPGRRVTHYSYPDGWRATDFETADEVVDVLVAVAAELLFNGRRRGLAAARRYVDKLLDDE